MWGEPELRLLCCKTWEDANGDKYNRVNKRPRLLTPTVGVSNRHKVAIARSGHYYTRCTDTRDRDQNLIGPILGP